MKNSPHPGEIIHDLYSEPLDLTVTQAGISPETLAPARSAGVAVRLSQAFGRTPESWLAVADALRNLAQFNQQVERIQVTPFGRPEAELMSAGI